MVASRAGAWELTGLSGTCFRLQDCEEGEFPEFPIPPTLVVYGTGHRGAGRNYQKSIFPPLLGFFLQMHPIRFLNSAQ